MNVVIPMAGRGERFRRAGHTVPKPLIEVHGLPLYAWAVSSLPIAPGDRLVFIALRAHLEDHGLADDLERRYPHHDLHVISLDGVTAGQAATVLRARELIDGKEPLLIHNADTCFRSGLAGVLAAPRHRDGTISVFESDEPHWSFVRVDEDEAVTEVAEKRPISRLACTGLYHFGRGADFVAAADDMIAADERVNGEFYVGPVYNRLIARGARIGIDRVTALYPMGTPDELDASAPRLAGELPSRV